LKRSDDKAPATLSRRSLLGGALAAALLAAAGPVVGRLAAEPASRSAGEKRRLPVWIGHM
jgi:hypothetical protein